MSQHAHAHAHACTIMEGMRYMYSVGARMASEPKHSGSQWIECYHGNRSMEIVTLCFNALMEIWIAVFSQTEYLTQDTIHNQQMTH